MYSTCICVIMNVVYTIYFVYMLNITDRYRKLYINENLYRKVLACYKNIKSIIKIIHNSKNTLNWNLVRDKIFRNRIQVKHEIWRFSVELDTIFISFTILIQVLIDIPRRITQTERRMCDKNDPTIFSVNRSNL